MFKEMALKARVDACHKAGKLFLIWKGDKYGKA
jgi:hypothetical protein